MFILRDLLLLLQAPFSNTDLGRERAHWFVFTLLAIIVPFTSSMTSNLLRSLRMLFGLDLSQRRFYTFMASCKLPWERLWSVLWGAIPQPLVDGRVLVAVDDSINNKCGRKIFGGGFFHDHTAKLNQPSYPWSQNIVAIGLLKIVKGRWSCLPLAFRFYFMKKDIEADVVTARKSGRTVAFQSKMAQALEMLKAVAAQFADTPVLVVADSWFGNNGLWRPLRESGFAFDLLSRLRANITLYDLPPARVPGQRGRTRKYGVRLGSVADCAAGYRDLARVVSVFLYGKRREVWAYDQVLMLKTLRCPVRVVWVFRKTRWVAFFTTDLTLSVEQVIEYYGARWKIESGFKEIKQEIGSARSQVRNAHAVINHLNFCMMATTLTWIYADRIKTDPQRRHIVKGRTSFAFSDVRRLIANVALSEDFLRLWPSPHKSPKIPFISRLLRMVA
ncbi:MAG: transposase [Gammaproteobacteria bacterium]|nr:transposase [Gammaproteobacteria bacterium]